MTDAVICRCMVPGCSRSVRLVSVRTACGPLDLTEGMCARHMATAAPDRLRLLRDARQELQVNPGLAQIVLFVQAWDAVKLSVVERQKERAA